MANTVTCIMLRGVCMFMTKISQWVVWRSMSLCFNILPKHFVGMIVVNMAYALLPVLGVRLSLSLYTTILEKEIGYGAFMIVIAVYSLYNILMRGYIVLYKRLVVQLGGIPRFEKKIRTAIHSKCNDLQVDNYEDPRFYNGIWSAQVAGINIYRITEYVIDAVAIIIGIVITGKYISTFNSTFWILIFLAAIPSFIEQFIEATIAVRYRSKEMELSKVEKDWFDSLTKIRSFKEIKAIHCYSELKNKWTSTGNILQEGLLKNKMRVLKYKAVLGLIKSLSQLSIYVFSAYLLFMGNINFPQFMATISAVTILNMQYTELFVGAGYFSKFIFLVKPYFSFIDQKKEKTISHSFNSLTVKSGVYHYPTSITKVIKDVNIEISSGEKIAIVGLNGAGKTTLAKIIMGYLKLKSGTISFDGIEHKEMTRFRISKSSALLQEFNKYENTLFENIVLDNLSQLKNVDKKDAVLRVDELLSLVGLDRMKQDKNSHIGLEFGNSDFSGGEWQRIALARSLYIDSKIIIMDEPTSSIDPIQENELNNLISSLDKTVIVITHRLSIAKRMDKIYLLNDGVTTEVGSHEELLSSDTLYKKLWESQLYY